MNLLEGLIHQVWYWKEKCFTFLEQVPSFVVKKKLMEVQLHYFFGCLCFCYHI